MTIYCEILKPVRASCDEILLTENEKKFCDGKNDCEMEPIHKNRKLKQSSGVDNEGWLNIKDSFAKRHSAKKYLAMNSMADAILELLQKFIRNAQDELYHYIMLVREIVGCVSRRIIVFHANVKKQDYVFSSYGCGRRRALLLCVSRMFFFFGKEPKKNIYTCTCIYTHVYIHVYIYMYVYVRIYVHMYMRFRRPHWHLITGL